MSGGWLQVVQEGLKVPGLLIEIYGDLARPGVKQVGKAIETIVGLGNTVLWPIALANEKARISLDRNMERYRKEMESVPEEKVVNVAPEIGVPVAEKLGYVNDESLANLYVKLLATASNADTLIFAHPSFVNVINNLSPDEARLLKRFVRRSNMPYVTVQSHLPKGAGHAKIAGPLVGDEVHQGLGYPTHLDAYLSNLAGLGLLTYRDDQWLTDEAEYLPIEQKYKPMYDNLSKNHPNYQGREIKMARGLVTITSFGKTFLSACQREAN